MDNFLAISKTGPRRRGALETKRERSGQKQPLSEEPGPGAHSQLQGVQGSGGRLSLTAVYFVSWVILSLGPRTRAGGVPWEEADLPAAESSRGSPGSGQRSQGNWMGKMRTWPSPPSLPLGRAEKLSV